MEIAQLVPEVAVECHLRLAREQLRWNDFEAARATLDALPPLIDDGQDKLSLRASTLRAEALVRSGEPSLGAQELEVARRLAPDDVGVALGIAELQVLRGDVVAARAALRALGARTAGDRHIDGRRCISLALSYMFEERFVRAWGWARRARLAYRHRGERAVDFLVPVVEVAALIGLDELDRATQIALRENAPPPDEAPALDGLGAGPSVFFRAAVLWRRGDLQRAVALAEPELQALDRRADNIFRAVATRDLARASLTLGRFVRAEELLRVSSGIAAEPGLAALRPMCELDFAYLAEARGDRAEAQRRVERALAGPMQSPFARVERWALNGAEPPRPSTPYGAVRAWADLRQAEASLERAWLDEPVRAAAAGKPTGARSRGLLDEAARAAESAVRWYRRVGADVDAVRALVALAEVHVRAGASEEARTTLSTANRLLEGRGYQPLAIALALVEASLHDREGDYDAYRRAIALAAERAATELTDGALHAACARVGVVPGSAPAPGLAAWRDRVERLGLARPAARRLALDGRTWLLAADDALPPGAFLTEDIDAGELRGAGDLRVPLPPQKLQLLDALVRAGAAGISLEQLYRGVWGAAEYHPLRHRNTVYVALARLRESLGRVAPAEAVVEVGEGRYRLAPELKIARLSANDSQSHAIPPGSPPGQTK
jgi:thioredoxin-like negative regulator of GroEL/DNA-binding winged helix-turn-helix (wHTH) protein